MDSSLKRILCIDDDPDILSIIEFSLTEGGGYEVAICHSGQEALTVVEGFQPQLFLVDVMMPQMSGPETLDALQSIPAFENTQAIFLTANVQFAAYCEAAPPKMLGVLTKPFDPMQLSERLQALWSEYME